MFILMCLNGGSKFWDGSLGRQAKLLAYLDELALFLVAQAGIPGGEYEGTSCSSDVRHGDVEMRNGSRCID